MLGEMSSTRTPKPGRAYGHVQGLTGVLFWQARRARAGLIGLRALVGSEYIGVEITASKSQWAPVNVILVYTSYGVVPTLKAEPFKLMAKSFIAYLGKVIKLDLCKDSLK